MQSMAVGFEWLIIQLLLFNVHVIQL